MDNQETNNQETSSWWDKLVNASNFAWNHLNIPFSALFHPKDTAYAIMVNKTGYGQGTFGSSRSLEDIGKAVDNRETIVSNRTNLKRNLSSLYIYGNDLGQFREAPELVPLGVNYDNYLRSIGRDPSEVVTYEGHFNDIPLVLPEGTQNILRSYILSKYNRTYGAENTPDINVDDVGGYLKRLDLDWKGDSIVVSSDLWDFEPNSYDSRWGHRTQAQLLDLIGTPFILKQVHPIYYMTPDHFYQNYDHYRSQWPELYDDLGYLPTLEVTKDMKRGNERGYIVDGEQRTLIE